MATRKRIVFISAYSGLVNRGVETVVDELSKRLSRDFDVTKIVGGGESRDNVIVLKVKIFAAGNTLSEKLFISKRRLQEFSFYTKALWRLREIKPDVVFVYNAGWHLLFYKLFSKIAGFKIILSGQSGPGWDDKINIWTRPDVFVCLTETQKKWAERVSKKQSYVVIPNGVDTKLFYPAKKPKNKRLVLTVGACEEKKNIDKVISALEDSDFDFLCVGDGTLAKDIDSLGKSVLSDRYQRISVKHDMLPDIYRSADVFVFLQDKSEAFGIVFLEAMASGLPIVCIDDSIRRELLGEYPVYTDMDPQNVFKSIKNAMTTKKLASTSKYDWDTIAKDYAKVIMKL